MLILKPLTIDWSVAGADIPAVTFIAQAGLTPVNLHICETPWSVFQDGSNKTILSSYLCQGSAEHASPKDHKDPRNMSSYNTATRHTGISSEMSSAKHIHSPQASYHVPGVFLKFEPTLTHKARSTAHVQLRTHCNPYGETASHRSSTQQSHQETLVPFASLSAISGTFNSLFKVLFTFPSWYLFAIGLEPIFSFR